MASLFLLKKTGISHLSATEGVVQFLHLKLIKGLLDNT